MGKQCSSFDKVMVIYWAAVWCVVLGSWPAVALAAPLERRQQNAGSTQSQQQQQPLSQGLIVGLSAGIAVVVLAGIILVVCFPPRKCARGRSTGPVKPWIEQTTTTTVTSYSRSGSSESTDSLTEGAAPLPMTRITNIDKRGRYIISKEVAAEADNHFAGPSSRRPPAALQRYSVHVTANGNNAISSRSGGSLSPLPEEISGASRFLRSEATMPVTSMKWPPISQVSPPAAMIPSTPVKSDLADRRGRPALQSIQVPSPSSLASAKGKGKARLYNH